MWVGGLQLGCPVDNLDSVSIISLYGSEKHTTDLTQLEEPKNCSVRECGGKEWIFRNFAGQSRAPTSVIDQNITECQDSPGSQWMEE